MNLAMKLFYGI